MQYLVLLLQAALLLGMCRVIHLAVTARIAAEEASDHAQAAASNSAAVAQTLAQTDDEPPRRHL